MVEIQTTFIGVVETCRSRYDTGIQGIYIKPLYIWDIINCEWLIIVNLHPPIYKYFLYPHLLMLPQYNTYNRPLYFLNTCENKSIEEFANIIKEFNLDNFTS